MLSRRTIDTLIDLAENKLTDIIPFDRDDMREIKLLRTCVDELRAIQSMPTDGAGRRSNRARAAVAAH